jgi:POT family proton-dependent oligopeptide transporter
MAKFLTMPDQTRTTMPGGVPYIVGNEAAERFSFYGMKGILVVFMTSYLLSGTGETAFFNDAEAREAMSWFVASAYLFPLIGAVIADAILGKYLTIMLLSWVYVLGHAALAMMDLPSAAIEATFEPRSWLLIGLFLIAVGSGGIKPCVSAHVGDQFGRGNSHLLSRVFGWFYFSINFGSFFSTLLTPWLLQWYGPAWAFGVPGVLMFLATIVFWMGRHQFVHIPPRGFGFVQELFSREGMGVLLKLAPVYLFIAVFWSLYDQTGSAWVLQAGKMDRTFFGIEWLESQIQAINPLLILAFIPLFTYIIYPAISKVFPLTPVRKISIGLFITVAAFAISGTIESWIEQGMTPNIAWQLLAYVVITAAEVMVSITALEFSYTQSPPKMKSLVMGLYLLTVSLGNVFTATVNRFIQVPSASDAITTSVEGLLSEMTTTGAIADPDGLVLDIPDPAGGFSVKIDLAEGGFEIDSPTKPHLTEAMSTIRQAWVDSSEDVAGRRLPFPSDGEALIAENRDNWEGSIRYRLISGDAFELRSGGVDQAMDTPDDVSLQVSVPAPPRTEEEIEAILAAPVTWAERHVPGKQRPSREELERADQSFSSEVQIGGGVTLPGASYYWFFTKVMLGAAVLFMIVARFYKPRDYIQGGDEFAGLDEAGRATVAIGETDDR